jgi:hypothetical protein
MVNPLPPTLADFHLSKPVASALAAMALPLVLHYLQRSALKGPAAIAVNSKSVIYAPAVHVFCLVGWAATIYLSAMCAFVVKDANIWAGLFMLCFLSCLFGRLHIEAVNASVTWDETNIYARSWLRKTRTVPLSAVTSCTYSPSMQYYINAVGHGRIALNIYMRGVANLLAILPCATPPYPPTPQMAGSPGAKVAS